MMIKYSKEPKRQTALLLLPSSSVVHTHSAPNHVSIGDESSSSSSSSSLSRRLMTSKLSLRIFVISYAILCLSSSSSSLFVSSFSSSSSQTHRHRQPPKYSKQLQPRPGRSIIHTSKLTFTSTPRHEKTFSSHSKHETWKLQSKPTQLENEEQSLDSFIQNKIFLGIQPTPEILAIMSIYFVEGALGLARLAQTFYLKDTLHLDPASLSALTGLFTLPWTIKPLYGFLSDGVPLFGYKRRSYLILCGLIGFCCYYAIGNEFFGLEQFMTSSSSSSVGVGAGVGEGGDLGENVQNGISMIQATVASFVISSGCIAFSDVVADGIVVQRTRDSNDPKIAGGLQSLCWGSASIGGLISAYFSGSLLEVMGPTDVFKITSILPLLVGLIAFFIDEEPVATAATSTAATSKSNAIATAAKDANEPGFAIELQPEQSAIMPSLAISPNNLTSSSLSSSSSSSSSMPTNDISKQISALFTAFKVPSIWKPALFLFLWQSTPTSEGAFLYFMTNDLGFGPEFLGRVRLVTAASSLIGVWGYQKYLRTVPIKKILLWTSIASAPLGLLNLLLISHANRSLGIPDGAFVFGDDVVLAILGQFAFLPTLVLAARICPPGIEAVLFATLMSIFNGASTVGTEVGAYLTKVLGVTESNFDNLGLLTIICNLSSLYPLIFIGLLDGVGSKSETEMEDELGGDAEAGTTVSFLEASSLEDT
mmetsp:Transcript_30320/g.35301  ORF Transcript_30320/g.35301 Transcript_30320/m.35301 type:complete len:706 (+) Transcript_30320:54-2171(+)